MNAFGIDISRSGVYQITNTANGKRYIGSSVNVWARWKCHVSCLRKNSHHNSHMQRAWNVCGEGKFVLLPLLLCERYELARYEQSCINILKPEYNKTIDVSAPMRGIKFSQEHKAKIAKANAGKRYRLGQKNTKEQNRRISEALTGKKLSEDHRINIGLSKMGNTFRLGCKATEETRDRLRLSHLGYVMPEEQKRKMSNAQKANPNNSGRFGMDNPGFLGHRHTEESKKKMSEATKRYYAEKRGEA